MTIERKKTCVKAKVNGLQRVPKKIAVQTGPIFTVLSTILLETQLSWNFTHTDLQVFSYSSVFQNFNFAPIRMLKMSWNEPKIVRAATRSDTHARSHISQWNAKVRALYIWLTAERRHAAKSRSVWNAITTKALCVMRCGLQRVIQLCVKEQAVIQRW